MADYGYFDSTDFTEDTFVDGSPYRAVVAPVGRDRGRNPLLRHGGRVPFLGDLFLTSPGEVDKESQRLLSLFYCRERVDGQHEDAESQVLRWMAADDAASPLLVVGDVGVGKSVFIRDFFLNRIPGFPWKGPLRPL